MRVTFREVDGSALYWHMDYLEVLPSIGHRVVIASADKGVVHEVEEIIHHVGGGDQRIEVFVSRVANP